MRNTFLLFALAGLLCAQQRNAPAPQGSAPDDDIPKFSSSVKEVMAPVTVMDRDGKIVNGLTPLDFRVLDNGKPQAFTLDTVSHPISLVVAVQANANVEAILPQIRKVGSVFDQLVTGDNGEIAVLAFDHRIQTMTPFTSDPDKIHDAFKNIKSGS